MKPLEVFLVLSLLAGALDAQRAGGLVRRAPKPIESVHLDLGTGVLTHGPAVKNRAATTLADFANVDLGGFVGLDSGNGFCEWFDAGVKGFQDNRSDLVSSILFAYCSSKLSTGSGGPGGSTKLGFYEGYLVGGGAPTTTVAAFTLTGLPGNTGSSSFLGGFRCYFLEVSFDPMLAFADGPIGYSWKFLDTGVPGVLAGTWPFLACVGSCSGIGGTLPDRQGMYDLIDRYCPPGTLRSTFTFGSTSGSYSSIAMELREARDLAATTLYYNASVTPNGDTLQANPAVLGRGFAAVLRRNPVTAPGTFTLLVRTTRLAANGLTPPPPVQGRLLIAGPLLGSVVGTHDGLIGTVQAQIPASFELLCRHFTAQALVLGGGIVLSSALEGTVGTF